MTSKMDSANAHSPRHSNRIAAMQFLYMWEVNRPEQLSKSMRQFFENQVQPREAYSFAEELVFGCLQQLETVDKIIQSHAENWSFSRIAKTDLAILRLAVYELLFRKDIPPIVSINEAIDLSKSFSTMESKRFINGILDKVKSQLDRPLRSAQEE